MSTLSPPHAAMARSATGLTLRDSTDTDVEAIQAIYAAHVLQGTGTFEEVAPDVTEIARRRADILARRLPYLVGGVGDSVQGFAYASLFRPRSAYRYTVEDSIYVDPTAVGLGLGLGRALLGELVVRCEALGYRQMVAVIGDSRNTASIQLHAALGFADAGTLTSVGFKFGRWVDAVFMQRPLGDGDSTLPAR